MEINTQPYQLELPFIKNNYKNNLDTITISELEINFNNSNQPESLQWSDDQIPSQTWDKRSKKKFYALVWANRYEEKVIKVYATSEMVAKKYLKENYLLNELYYSPDFPTTQLNQQITNEFKLQKRIDQEIYDV
jgi:hypothetical protein